MARIKKKFKSWKLRLQSKFFPLSIHLLKWYVSSLYAKEWKKVNAKKNFQGPSLTRQSNSWSLLFLTSSRLFFKSSYLRCFKWTFSISSVMHYRWGKHLLSLRLTLKKCRWVNWAENRLRTPTRFLLKLSPWLEKTRDQSKSKCVSSRLSNLH